MPLTLMYITNNPAVASIAEKNGVQRIWIDLETLGKEERQHRMNTVKSHHTIGDIRHVRSVLTTSELLVRVNPLHPGSATEIDRVIDAGADLVMLPMWKTPGEVNEFLRMVGGRAKTVLLLETKEAAECVDEVLTAGGFDEIHIGLNDLHLSYGLSFMFELLSDGTVEMLCCKFRKAGVPYGFGGVARIGSGLLPAERIVMEHYRLGSTRAILSRSFCNTEAVGDLGEIGRIFRENMRILREFEASMPEKTAADFENNRAQIRQIVATITGEIRR